jgi:site-specific DNA recombinase
MALSASVVATEPLIGIYTRISSDDDARVKQLGVKRQEKACRALCEAQGWPVVDVYCDNNRSASKETTNRPDFDRMLADLSSGRITKVVVLAQDRLLRKPDELEMTMRLLRRLGISEIQTVTDGVVNIGTTTGRTMARVKGVFDIAYAEYISEKVSQKKEELAEAGLPSGGGSRPYGYEPGGMVVQKAEAAVVKEAAKRVLAGQSLRSIARDLNSRGLYGATGRPWSLNQLGRMLSSRRIAGIREHKGEVVGDAAWPAIIDRKTHERLRETLTGPHRRRDPVVRSYLFTGVVVCGRCGAKLIAGKNNGARAYRCPTKERGGCDGLAVKAGTPLGDDEPGSGLEGVLVEAIFAAVDTPAMARAIRKETRGEPDGDHVAALIAEDEALLLELADDLGEKRLSRAEWLAARAPVERRLEQHRRQLVQPPVAAAVHGYVGRQGALRAAWQTMTFEERLAVVRAVMEKVVVNPAVTRGRHVFDPARIPDDGIVWRF